MVDVETGCFTVAVFQDATWAANGLNALKAGGFTPAMLTVIGKETAEVGALIEQTLGSPGDRLELARGSLVEVLQGSAGDLAKLGLAGTMRKVGFQPHDSRIFETLTGRGGILVAVLSEPRAADALAIFHSYGGGNAAIGAWTGRL